jgi:hypothetical protein
MRLRTGDTIACPAFGIKLQLDVYAAHAYGRGTDNLTLKEDQSGRVRFLSAARSWIYGIPDVSHIGSSSTPGRYDMTPRI